MKKILIILIAILIFTSCVHAQDNTTVEINGVIFEIPEKYKKMSLAELNEEEERI